MGLLIKKQVDEDVLMGVWEITEDYDTLFNSLKLLPEEIARVNSFHSNGRKLEWLSVRVLLQTILERDARIVYNEHRKPFLYDNSYQISISHSHKLTSVMLSKTKRIGIDLEYMKHDIERVAHKFINDKEKITANANNKKFHIYIHWCAKEALYKICDKIDINFKHNLTIEAFEPANEGLLKGTVHNKLGTDVYLLRYFLIENYIVVWCDKEIR